MAKIKNLGIKKIYEKKLKENEDLRNKLKESDAELSELKKLYDRQLKWEETGEQLKIEVSKYLEESKKQKKQLENTEGWE